MIMHRSPAFIWGTTATERAMPFPCDHHLYPFDDAYFRAVNVQAPAHVLFRWLCQLRVAPYSYDWIDNFGHSSPRELIAGMDDLKIGQRVMIFRLAEFEPNRHITLLLTAARARAIFGEVAISYVILPRTEQSCRLVVKLLVRYPPIGPRFLMRRFLSWGDLLMMRKQLLTFKQLAERQARDEKNA